MPSVKEKNTRIESIGTYLPATSVSTAELLDKIETRAAPPIEALTGVRQRRVYDRSADGYEDSFVLATRAAEDALTRSRYRAEDLDVVISTSITRRRGPDRFSIEPAFSGLIADGIGAKKAATFDIGNACAGMVTGVMVLDRMIRQGLARTGMVVSGEQITPIAETAVREITEQYDPQFASLSVGDAGASVVIDTATDDADIIDYVDLMTSSGYAEFCLGKPSDKTEGVAMYTDNKSMHTEERYLQGIRWYLDYLRARGTKIEEEKFDFILHHQFSSRALDYINALLERESGVPAPTSLTVMEDFGNTASTSHFVALHEHLKRGTIAPGSKILVIPSASGMVYGHMSLRVSALRS
ncbi:MULTISPECIES: 3-oxoacyl-ACP synthase III family protein [unclassified Nocardia]|uniref:3-oxoacyl-ACP synthase III family protein n=1 Tax=unclassified Nocardia TaxID=2637762 RepID=UPI001CE4A28B|nr:MULTISPECIES: 3-oxoacyl-[acyl-carrier-protein] synthase III C-terminal domain-containing protein [unclassified Nocardia]